MDVKLSAPPKGKPSPTRQSATKERKYCDEGQRANEILFPHPLFVSSWLDDTTLLVGGGGGSRFGFTNTLVLLQLPTQGARKGKGPSWSAIGVLDLGEDVVWCMSELIDHPSTDGAKLFAASSVGCLYLLEAVPHAADSTSPNAERLPQRWALQKRARVSLATDPDNPDKKPLALTTRAPLLAEAAHSSTLFAAQDDCSVAVFDCHSLLEHPDGAPAAASTIKEHWRGRIRSVSAQALANGSCILATVSEDAVLRFFLLNRTHGIERQIELDESKLGLPFRMLKSTLRCVQLAPEVHSGERALSATSLFLTVFDAVSSTSLVISGALEYTKKSLHFEEQTRFTLPKESISATAVIPTPHPPVRERAQEREGDSPRKESGGSSSEDDTRSPLTTRGSAAYLLLATVDGNVYLCRRDHPTDSPKLIAQRRALHTEPISSVAVTHSGGWGAVVTTDIAQRAILSSLNLPNSTSKGRSPAIHAHLPALFAGSTGPTSLRFALLVFVFVLAIILSLWGLSPFDGLE